MKKKTIVGKVMPGIAAVFLLLVLLLILMPDNAPEHRAQWWLASIDWSERQSYTGEGVRIAVVDTGIDASHKDLSEALIEELSVINDSGRNDVRHGTAVAGILAVYPSDESGLLGICHDAEIISIDVTNEENGIVSVDSLIAGIELAIEEDADVINISIGVRDDNRRLEEAVKAAVRNGIIVVASAGNYMIDDIMYPAKYPEVIAAGAETKKNTVISPAFEKEERIPGNLFYLPGDNIVTLGIDDEYISAYGTSFSSAILTGMIAVGLQKDESLNQERVLEIMSKLDNGITVGAFLDEI